ncbi:MAG: nucleoside deaminase [Bacteroidetes bacterium]|nr:nucleoside deaminase [Bacteroidota bacterium]
MTYTLFSDEYFMNEALKEARKAFDEDEVPVGAIIVSNNVIIARAHNMTERLNDVTAHAEMQAFGAASNYLGAKYLTDCVLYVTIEPCAMCAAAASWTQIERIVYGADDEKKGFLLIRQNLLHPKTLISHGVLQTECAGLMTEFFRSKRAH